MSRLKTREVLVALIACTGISDPCWEQNSGQECSVHIVQSKSGQSVRSPENVIGTAHIPVGTRLWVLAHRKGLAVWWPQGGASADLSASDWAVMTFFGEPRDDGADFEVTARVFDERQNAALEALVKHTIDTGQFPGITMPPYVAACGAETVTVRKSG
jgi:hypothetical protein